MRINIHAGIEYHEVGLAVTVEIVHHHYGIERLCRVHDELGGVAEPTVILAQPCRRGTYPATPLNGGAARTGGPVDISKLFELEIAQWAEVDLRAVPRLVDDAAWGDNREADEFMLQPGGIDAITEFWNWINDRAGSGGVGLHGDFNMTGSYDEWENARRLIERGERKLSDYGGELPSIEPPEEWKRYFDWQRQFRTGSAI